jgi:hypothetical protein
MEKETNRVVGFDLNHDDKVSPLPPTSRTKVAASAAV